MSGDGRTSLPITKRKSIVFGGFARDTLKDVIEQKLRSATTDVKDQVEDLFCPGKFGSVGIIVFKTSKSMWDFLKGNKGKRFKHGELELWHTIEKTKQERDIAKRVSKAVRLLREHLETSGGKSEAEAKEVIDADWVKGLVFAKVQNKVVRVYEKKTGEDVLHVAPVAADSGLTFDFAGHVDTINMAA